jgi:AcrR family transcriptional regulator
MRVTAERRRQIVAAAVAVMAERGWNEASIDEITRTAGVSRGLVSYHFKDKADLLSGVLARCQETFNESVAAAIAESENEVERLRLIIRKAIALTREDPISYQVFLHFAASARSQPELGEQIRLLYERFRRATAAGIRAGQGHGHFRPELEPEATAAQIVGTIVGLALQWLLDPEGYPFEPAARQTEEMLMAYVCTASAPSTAALTSG